MDRTRFHGAAAGGVALLLLVAPGCSRATTALSHPPAGAEQAAASIAESLSRKQIADNVSGDHQHAQTDLDEIVSRTGWVMPSVRAVSVTGSGDRADATLRFSWPTGDQPYSYDTHVHLTNHAGAWQWDWSPAIVHPRADGQHGLQIRRTVPDRGRILGARGETLMAPRPVVRVGVDKGSCEPAQYEAAVNQLAEKAQLEPGNLRTAVNNAGPQAFVVAITYRDVAPFDVTTVPCGKAVPASQILAPTKEFAAQVLGAVGPATRELIDRSGGQLREGDQVGLSGLQARYDDVLAGKPGWKVSLVDRANGNQTDELHQVTLVPGRDLATTLDAALQEKADVALKKRGGVGAVAVIQPSTGNILALATSDSAQSLAATGQYPPGSTFKVVTALALLRTGHTPDSKLDCPTTINVGGRSIHNYPGYPTSENGQIPLERAIGFSCNTAFINASSRYSDDDMIHAAQALGIGDSFDLGFPNYLGAVQRTDGPVAKAEQSFGQGTTLGSPLATTAMTASVAAGHTVIPHLVDGKVAVPHPSKPLTAKEAQELRQMMRVTVTEGSAASLQDVLEGAKTGTAEFNRDGELLTHISMTGYTSDDVAITAFGDLGNYGTDLAPVLREILR